MCVDSPLLHLMCKYPWVSNTLKKSINDKMSNLMPIVDYVSVVTFSKGFYSQTFQGSISLVKFGSLEGRKNSLQKDMSQLLMIKI